MFDFCCFQEVLFLGQIVIDLIVVTESGTVTLLCVYACISMSFCVVLSDFGLNVFRVSFFEKICGEMFVLDRIGIVKVCL